MNKKLEFNNKKQNKLFIENKKKIRVCLTTKRVERLFSIEKDKVLGKFSIYDNEQELVNNNLDLAIVFDNICEIIFKVSQNIRNWGIFNEVVIIVLIKIVLLLVGVAYFTIAERKVMASIQRRLGPNVVGFLGLGQPLADGAKLVVKEVLVPTRADRTIFLLAPILILILSIMSWSILPGGVEFVNIYDSSKDLWEVYSSSVGDIYYGILLILAVSGLNAYGIIMAGWSSNSKYAFLGGLRSAAQMISYEVSLGLLLLPIILLAGSLNLSDIVMAQENTVWFFLPLFPCVWMFFISILAETNRAPFDLPEAEAELVAGYNVEYSSIIFAMFFLGEYTNMLLMSTIIVLFFFGGWLPSFNFFVTEINFWLAIKLLIFCHLYILIRAGLPRLRYDQLMELGWKIFLPISLGYLLYVIGILYFFDGLPQVFEIYKNPYKEFLLF